MGHRVTIGITVQAEPDQLLATLAGVRANTSITANLVILGDGPDALTNAVL
jgi:hypothetical protein